MQFKVKCICSYHSLLLTSVWHTSQVCNKVTETRILITQWILVILIGWPYQSFRFIVIAYIRLLTEHSSWMLLKLYTVQLLPMWLYTSQFQSFFLDQPFTERIFYYTCTISLIFMLNYKQVYTNTTQVYKQS